MYLKNPWQLVLMQKKSSILLKSFKSNESLIVVKKSGL